VMDDKPNQHPGGRVLEPPFARQVLMSPLHMELAGESATNSWTGWNGYTVPARLSSFEAEYQALRYGAALADYSPRVTYRLAGRDVMAYLQRLITGNAATLEVDTAMPVAFCDDRGWLVGVARLFRMADAEYRLVTEEAQLDWLLSSAIGFQVQVEDISAAHACIALLGPLALRVIEDRAPGDQVASLTANQGCGIRIAGMPVFVMANATGALAPGYEIWTDMEDATTIWRHLRRSEAVRGLCAVGQEVLDLARIEAGLPRPGQDYQGIFSAVTMQTAITPYDLGLGAQIDFSKGNFTGRAALLAIRDGSPNHPVMHLRIEGLEPVACSTVTQGGQQIGRVTSARFSPAQGANIGLARLAMPKVGKSKKRTKAWLVDVETGSGRREQRQAWPVADCQRLP